MNKNYSYKLNYTLWDMDTNLSRLIRNDAVSFPEPKDHKEIMMEVQEKWQLLKGKNVHITNMNINIMAV